MPARPVSCPGRSSKRQTRQLFETWTTCREATLSAQASPIRQALPRLSLPLETIAIERPVESRATFTATRARSNNHPAGVSTFCSDAKVTVLLNRLSQAPAVQSMTLPPYRGSRGDADAPGCRALLPVPANPDNLELGPNWSRGVRRLASLAAVETRLAGIVRRAVHKGASRLANPLMTRVYRGAGSAWLELLCRCVFELLMLL